MENKSAKSGKPKSAQYVPEFSNVYSNNNETYKKNGELNMEAVERIQKRNIRNLVIILLQLTRTELMETGSKEEIESAIQETIKESEVENIKSNVDKELAEMMKSVLPSANGNNNLDKQLAELMKSASLAKNKGGRRTRKQRKNRRVSLRKRRYQMK